MEKRAQTWTRAAAGVRYLSNRHYNQGLALARQKKLSKAQRALEISLKYNKYNKDARNLLGLIEYSRGEAGQAVAAWAVSAGLNPENNIAHTYIKAIQKCPEGREGIDRPHKRYNRALLAAMEGNTDIAAIELKKAVKERPNYVRAKQLLALICIKNGQRREAGRWLESSLEDDRDNEDSMKWLRLLQEDGQGRKGLKKADRPSNRKKTDKKNISRIFKICGCMDGCRSRCSGRSRFYVCAGAVRSDETCHGCAGFGIQPHIIRKEYSNRRIETAAVPTKGDRKRNIWGNTITDDSKIKHRICFIFFNLL